MSERLKGKIAIVTGAGTGIGQAIAILFAHEGARVSICGRTPATLAETAHYIAGDGGEVIQLVYDISKADPIESMVLKTVERFGKLDILVNNAGIRASISTVLELMEQEWQQTFDIGAKGSELYLKYAIPEI